MSPRKAKCTTGLGRVGCRPGQDAPKQRGWIYRDSDAPSVSSLVLYRKLCSEYIKHWGKRKPRLRTAVCDECHAPLTKPPEVPAIIHIGYKVAVVRALCSVSVPKEMRDCIISVRYISITDMCSSGALLASVLNTTC